MIGLTTAERVIMIDETIATHGHVSYHFKQTLKQTRNKLISERLDILEERRDGYTGEMYAKDYNSLLTEISKLKLL